MSSVSSQPQFRYTQSPSKVLHLRNLPWECTKKELIELGKPFGKVVNTKCNVGANRNQAFIEFADQNQAISMISYYASSSEPAQVRGKTVYLQYSNRQEIVNNKTTADVAGNVKNINIITNHVGLQIDRREISSRFIYRYKVTSDNGGDFDVRGLNLDECMCDGNIFYSFVMLPSAAPVECNLKRKRPEVETQFLGKIPFEAIHDAFEGKITKHYKEAIRFLNVVLRTKHLRFVDKDGVLQGFRTSLRTTQSGLSLRIDVSTTTFIKPAPVLNFLLDNQIHSLESSIDWEKAKRILENLRLKTSHTNQEYKITGFSKKCCREQIFTFKQRTKNGEFETTEMTVYDYFMNILNIDVLESADYPCIIVEKRKCPFFPIELCSLVLQRYTKALSPHQRSNLVKESLQKPQERMSILSKALMTSNYDAKPLLQSCGISIEDSFMVIQGRVLKPPKMKFGNGEYMFPGKKGSWNFHDKKFVEPCKMEGWAVVNFSSHCNVNSLVKKLMKVGKKLGMEIRNPIGVLLEEKEHQNSAPNVRVHRMFDKVLSKISEAEFILCLLPESKNCPLYGPWKQRSLSELGIVTQCMSPPPEGLDYNYLTGLIIKINSKLGGLSSMLIASSSLHNPTMIVGMNLTRQSDVSSIAAVVGSMSWPSVSQYGARLRTQPPKAGMIDSLYLPVANNDQGIFRELLLDFIKSSNETKPERVIIFRDGVAESQFNRILDFELHQIIKACKFYDEIWRPKFVVVVAQKCHHTEFFEENSVDVPPPGTVIDHGICEPGICEFYMWAHAGTTGTTTRPTHYHVLLDQVGFSVDDLQEIVHCLSYAYQRSSTAISVVAPIRYAHLAAKQAKQAYKLKEEIKSRMYF